MKKPSKKIIATALGLFQAGHSMKAIGRSMGRSLTWVQAIIREYGRFWDYKKK